MNNAFVLIMAGGEGTRFAPISTPERPKQFLNFVGKGTFIQQTRMRVHELFPANRVFVATNDRYVDLVRKQLPDIPFANIVAEPMKKNTAPCIAYAAALMRDRNPDAAMIVLPSDHVINNQKKFLNNLNLGLKAARISGRLITLGIKPDRPATCYGYIKATQDVSQKIPLIQHVESFVEKPDEQTAKRYIDERMYYWNSGMFIWTIEGILGEIRQHLPQMYKILDNFKPGEEFKNNFFKAVEAISIDYGIMEKSDKISMIPCEFDWSDIGTWESLQELAKKNEVEIDAEVMRVMNEVLNGKIIIEK